MNEIMQSALDRARQTMTENIGGPFGAAIIDEKGEVLSVASNSVLRDNDPTAHAEVNAIRAACQKIGSYDLSGCVLYTTAYPCPMCLSAIIWANIKKVYFGCRPSDAEAIGFRDDFIYRFIENECRDKNVMQIAELDREDCLKLFQEYQTMNKTIY
ncbi:MAG: nucleoside deaminase [Alphaproteobacteria bacterium]|nr:nucleoside deaminase [Alphaproteobacteria bacterium]